MPFEHFSIAAKVARKASEKAGSERFVVRDCGELHVLDDLEMDSMGIKPDQVLAVFDCGERTD